MKGKVLSIITAVLFGATMVASPIVFWRQGPTSRVPPARRRTAPEKRQPKRKPGQKEND